MFLKFTTAIGNVHFRYCFSTYRFVKIYQIDGSNGRLQFRTHNKVKLLLGKMQVFWMPKASSVETFRDWNRTFKVLQKNLRVIADTTYSVFRIYISRFHAFIIINLMFSKNFLHSIILFSIKLSIFLLLRN